MNETSGRAAGCPIVAPDAVFRPFWTGDVRLVRHEARMTALRASGGDSSRFMQGPGHWTGPAGRST